MHVGHCWFAVPESFERKVKNHHKWTGFTRLNVQIRDSVAASPISSKQINQYVRFITTSPTMLIERPGLGHFSDNLDAHGIVVD